jgi:2-haloacid dehalogenase
LIEQYPGHPEHINLFYDRWEEMLNGPIEGTVEIFRKLKATGKYKFYALTNWSEELFPIALRQFRFLKWFDGIVVSGTERIRKPEPAFYQILLDRYNIEPEEALFIDDNINNVQAATKMDIKSIQFTSPEDLDKQLKQILYKILKN